MVGFFFILSIKFFDTLIIRALTYGFSINPHVANIKGQRNLFSLGRETNFGKVYM